MIKDMEPATAILAGAALGSAAQSFVQDLYAGGKAWFLELIGKHQPKSEAEAVRRIDAMLTLLAQKLYDVEQSNEINTANLGQMLGDPAFTLCYHSSVRGAAETNDAMKHNMLARLVCDRLSVESESEKALLLAMGVSVVPRIGRSHLAAVGIHAAIRFGAPNFASRDIRSRDGFLSVCNAELERLLQPFLTVPISSHDLEHLTSVGCGLLPSFAIATGKDGLWDWKHGRNALDAESFRKLPILNERKELWSSLLIQFRPTPCGALVGLAALEAAGSSLSTRNWRHWYPKTQESSVIGVV